ncbi:hypothetical protein LCGC14_0265080 [marine sediment metagenome]|uniref:Uncharacterized protein n=1 Tax=marine sediment metagenome TaxID=412755 RepID=A0A0F9U136_9ZZZZ
MSSKMKRAVDTLAREIYIQTMAVALNDDRGVKPTRSAEACFECALKFFKVQEGVVHKCR